MSKFVVQKAVREKIYPKIALMGASGCGKTYSALRLATGMKARYEEMTGEKWTIIFGNTEGSRGRYYANEFEYDIVDLEAPFNPELFVDFLEYVEKLNNVILILDSTSHEWDGKGGCLELHGNAGGRYQDWAKITPRHDKFINKMASISVPMIATMRGKDAYNMTQDEKGKTKVEKVGVGAKQRDGFEYEFTATFMLDQKSNMAEHFKDNTHIFDREGAVILSEAYGTKIVDWANSSSAEPQKQVDKEELNRLIAEIDKLAKAKAKTNKDEVVKAIEDHTNEVYTKYKSISDIDVAKKVKESLEKVVVTKSEEKVEA